MLSLGIDIGTSGIRSAVVSPDRTVHSMARADHFPQDSGRVDANLWWDAVRICIKRQTRELQSVGIDPAEIACITVDGTSGTMVLTDADLVPVSWALMYDSKGFDAEAARIARFAPDPHIARGSGSALARALRLADEADEGAKHLLHQVDFIAAQLTAQGGRTDVTNALKTGIDPETGTWPDWIQRLLPNGLLPAASPVGACWGAVREDLHLELGLGNNVKVYAGTTDSIAAFLAAAPLKAGVAVTSLGSTLAVKTLCRTRIDDPERGLYSHRVGGSWLVGGASNTGGRVLRHYFSDTELAKLSEKIDPNQNTGLDYYPLLEPGERFPVNDPKFAPRLSPRPSDDAVFLHGLFDGMARIEAQCYAAIAERSGEYPDKILSAGGGAKNPVFTRIRSRRLGTTPEPALQTEAAVGAAMIPFFHFVD